MYSFRVPSGTLQLRRPLRNDQLLEFAPQGEEPLIGIRSVGGADFLVVNLSYRKNLARGAILKRLYFCGLDYAMDRLTFPVHS